MGNRPIPLALIGLLLVLHAQLCFGRGGVPNLAQLKSQIGGFKRSNGQDVAADHRLAAEIRAVKEGLAMVEEMAGTGLGLVRLDEIHLQIARR